MSTKHTYEIVIEGTLSMYEQTEAEAVATAKSYTIENPGFTAVIRKITTTVENIGEVSA